MGGGFSFRRSFLRNFFNAIDPNFASDRGDRRTPLGGRRQTFGFGMGFALIYLIAATI